MSYRFPEQPMLLYPSLVEQFGLEEALLLGVCHQRAQQLGTRDHRGQLELQLDSHSWLQLVPFWNQQKLTSVVHSLVAQRAVEANMSADAVRIVLLDLSDQAQAPAATPVVRSAPPPRRSVPPAQPRTQMEPPAAEIEQVSRLSVMDEPPPRVDAPPLGVVNKPNPPAAPRTPAPSFGGSTGWRKHKSELQVLFEQHEERNQKLHPIFLGWQPSATFFSMLPRHGISEAFARECIDEFVLYWLDKDRRETNWDQKFLGWVKREWVKKQTRDGREQRQAQQQTGFNHENTRRDSREKRKRVTQAIMDIKDTDW